MDRSFLSQPEVIAASRAFVCVRLATYENADEAKFLKGITPTRSSELENSVFCLMSPDGKDKLVRGARSMRSIYSDAADMAEGMNRVAVKYATKGSPLALPLVTNVRLAIDIAAADNQPLVVVVAKDEAVRTRLIDQMSKLAWTDDFIGRFIYVKGSAGELAHIEGVKIESGVLVMSPDKFGQRGSVLNQVEAGASAAEISDAFRKALTQFKPETKTFQNHVREGQRQGIFWDTHIPVTDPQENAARERGRKLYTPKD
jgi:hypothetical protein